MKSDFDWTEERVTRLRALWADGKSASAIAAQLGCTRSAVIGKAHRIGCPRRPSPIASGRPRIANAPRSLRTKVPRPLARAAFAAARAAAMAEAEAPAPLDARTIWDPHDPRQEPTGYRFILGHPNEAGWRYCQAVTPEFASWCPVHRAIVFREVAPAGAPSTATTAQAAA